MKAGSKLRPDQIIYTSIKSHCAQPSGICLPCQYRGLGISKFCMAWGSGISLHVSPTPELLTCTWFPILITLNMEDFPGNTSRFGNREQSTYVNGRFFFWSRIWIKFRGNDFNPSVIMYDQSIIWRTSFQIIKPFRTDSFTHYYWFNILRQFSLPTNFLYQHK